MTETVARELAGVWRRSRPLFEERLANIERAVDELSERSAEPSQIAAGCGDAHKLAGVLGTFGLDRGTVLAHDLETHLGRAGAGREAPRLARVAAELRGVVEGAPGA